MQKFKLALFVTAVFLSSTPPADASSGRVKSHVSEDITQLVFSIRPFTSFRVQTFAANKADLPNPDVILDLFSAEGRLLKEGLFSDADVEFPRGAEVVLDAIPFSRTVTLIVRGAAGTLPGQATLLITSVRSFPNKRVQKEALVSYAATPRLTIPQGLPAASHVMTVQQLGGPEDTIIMALSGGKPVALDDDDGIEAMSWLHLNQACTSNCEVIVGRRTNALSSDFELKKRIPAPGVVTVVWDDDIHSNDKDRDGLSDALERQLGTRADEKDTDNDGISDAFEVIGREDLKRPFANLGKFAFYGADPLRPDIFLEADYLPGCLDTQGGCTLPIKNRWKMPPAVAAGIAARFLPRFSVHIDTGSPNAADSFSGDWGGAMLLADGTKLKNYCEGSSKERTGLFHHAVMTGGAQTYGACGGCSVLDFRAGASAHELGHQFGLGHFGDTKGSKSGPANCKPNYQSIMSYVFQDNQEFANLGRAFSQGSFLQSPLNPIALDESRGLGVNDAATLGLVHRTFGRRVDATTGAIDWNMDNRIEPAGTTVAGMLNYAFADCDIAPPAQRANWNFAKDYVKGTVTATGESSLKIYAVSKTGRLISSTGNVAKCKNQGFGACAGWTDTKILANAVALRAPAAVGSFLVYADKNNLLRYISDPSKSTLPVGGPPVDGDPVAIEAFGAIRVYAPSGGVLRKWEWSKAAKQWTELGAVQRWSDGRDIKTVFGIGLTKGFQSDLPDESLYAVIPTPDATGQPVLEFARLGSQRQARKFLGFTLNSWVETWTALGPEVWGGLQDVNNDGILDVISGQKDIAYSGKPALMYAPFDKSNPKDGRFYLAFTVAEFQPTETSLVPANLVSRPYIRFTQGNRFPLVADPSTQERPLMFINKLLYRNVWSNYPNGFSMAYFNGSVNAVAYTPEPKSSGLTFFPNADGQFNGVQRDHDDVSAIEANLIRSLKKCQ